MNLLLTQDAHPVPLEFLNSPYPNIRKTERVFSVV